MTEKIKPGDRVRFAAEGEVTDVGLAWVTVQVDLSDGSPEFVAANLNSRRAIGVPLPLCTVVEPPYHDPEVKSGWQVVSADPDDPRPGVVWTCVDHSTIDGQPRFLQSPCPPTETWLRHRRFLPARIRVVSRGAEQA